MFSTYPFCIQHFPLLCFLCFYKFFSTCQKFLQMRYFSPSGIFEIYPLELAQFALDTSFLTASPLSSQFEDWSNVRRSRPAFYSHVPLSAMLIFTIGTFFFSAGNSSLNAALLCEITVSTTGACFEVTHSALLTTCLEILLCWKGTEFPMVELILLFSLLLALILIHNMGFLHLHCNLPFSSLTGQLWLHSLSHQQKPSPQLFHFHRQQQFLKLLHLLIFLSGLAAFTTTWFLLLGRTS